MTAPFLTPSVAKLLEAVAAGPVPGPDAPAQRAALDGAMAQLGWPDAAPADSIMAAGDGVNAHLFESPGTPQPARLIVYLHGGSFMAGGVPAHFAVARAISDASGCAVALVDYRLAPEHKSPAALDDCVAAIRALLREPRFGGLYALLGDSAGGFLAAAAALALDESERPAVVALVNPMTSATASGGSLDDFASGYFASADDFRLGWDAYGGDADLLQGADVARLPPLLVFTNEADPVRDQGERLAEAASGAGVPVVVLRMRGLVHAAWLFPKALPEAALILDTVAGAIAARLRRD